MDAIEFQKPFDCEEQCEAAPVRLRWPRGFICPSYEHNDGYQLNGIASPGDTIEEVIANLKEAVEIAHRLFCFLADCIKHKHSLSEACRMWIFNATTGGGIEGKKFLLE